LFRRLLLFVARKAFDVVPNIHPVATKVWRLFSIGAGVAMGKGAEPPMRNAFTHCGSSCSATRCIVDKCGPDAIYVSESSFQVDQARLNRAGSFFV
jgi:hypothetical protein